MSSELGNHSAIGNVSRDTDDGDADNNDRADDNVNLGAEKRSQLAILSQLLGGDPSKKEAQINRPTNIDNDGDEDGEEDEVYDGHDNESEPDLNESDGKDSEGVDHDDDADNNEADDNDESSDSEPDC